MKGREMKDRGMGRRNRAGGGVMLALLMAMLMAGCKAEPEIHYPAAPGFVEDSSDARALELADRMMRAQGGMAAYHAADTFRWTFFARRGWVWSKKNNWAECHDLRTGIRASIALDTPLIQVQLPDSLEGTSAGKEAPYDVFYERWINDSYWLLMPYKLKDKGVQLTYVGKQADADGRPAEVVQLRFEGVGVTPENQYHVWFDSATGLISQWSFYASRTDSVPAFITRWSDYHVYHGVVLASNRSVIIPQATPLEIAHISVDQSHSGAPWPAQPPHTD